MARVYVSSTFQDLQECREQVRLTLQRMGHVDVSMELYPASEERPLDRCLADVAGADLYVGLVAWRYGFVPAGQDRSITELEYRHAGAVGTDRLVFVLAEDASWPGNRVERSAIAQVDAFRALVQDEQVAAYFTGPDDVGARVAEAVHGWETRRGVAAGPRTDWEAYRAAVFAKHRSVRLSVIAGAKQDREVREIPLTGVFVAQPSRPGRPAYDVPEDETADALPQPSLDVLGREPKQVVLGGPGSGKTTLFHLALLRLCDPVPDEAATPPHLRHGPVPFLVELRQYTLRRSPGFVDYLVAQARDYYGADLHADDLRTLLREPGRALVLFDGLDEILNAAERERAVEQFDAFARQFPDAGVVVSSRIAGYDPERLALGGFAHHTLLDFGLTEIRQFLPRWYDHYPFQDEERDAAGLVQRIVDSPRLLTLAGNPLLLTMMAVIYRHQDLPEKRWQLYRACTQVLLEDWDVKRKNIERDELLPLDFRMVGEQKAELLQDVAMHMLGSSRPGEEEINAISRDALVRIVAAYLERTYGKSPGDARAIGTDILDHLRERTYILAEIGEDTFGFVHRTFMEYFAARHALAEFNRRKADYAWLTGELFGRRWRREEWQEVLLLLMAMLKDQGSPIEEVVDRVLWEERDLHPPVNVPFAARCLGEAGPTDAPWDRGVLDRLVGEALDWLDGAAKEDVAAFLDDCLAAFSLLVPTVPLSEHRRQQIERRSAESRRNRAYTWQLSLASRSRSERRLFAVDALQDRTEAVRLGAIAALERDWSGREDVGEALVHTLATDRVTRVRQAALLALGRSWPAQPGVLEAIAARADDETAYTYVGWLIEHLAERWPGSTDVLDLVLRLVGSAWGTAPSYARDDLVGAAVTAIAEGWTDVPAAQLLRDHVDGTGNPMSQAVAVLALATGWPGGGELPSWLRRRMSGVRPDHLGPLPGLLALHWPDDPATWDVLAVLGRTPLLRVAAFREMARSERPEPVEWLVGRAVDDPEVEVRAAALDALAERPGRRVADLLHERAAADPAPDIRMRALLLAAGLRPAEWSSLSRWPWLVLVLETVPSARIAGGTVDLVTDRMRADPDARVRAVAVGVCHRLRVGGMPAAVDHVGTTLRDEPDPSGRIVAVACALASAVVNRSDGVVGSLLVVLPEIGAGLRTSGGRLDVRSLLVSLARGAGANTRLPGRASPRAEWARSLLRSTALGDPDAEVRLAAVSALVLSWSTAWARPGAVLAEMLATETDPDLRKLVASLAHDVT